MSDTTTVRVGRATRDHLNRVSTARGETVDALIQRALRLLELEERRQLAVEQSRALAGDPADRAEVQAAIREALGE
jgi:Arc/MetJ family transcription regulator